MLLAGAAGPDSDEGLHHDMGIQIAQLPVPKGSGQGAYQLKAVLLPAAQTSGVSANHQVNCIA